MTAASTITPVATCIRATLVLERRERDAIDVAARHQFPGEFCGLLLGRRLGSTFVVEQLAHTPNIAPASARSDRYEINPGLLIAWQREAEKHGLKVLGFVHSQTDLDVEPGEQDSSKAWADYVYLIASMRDGRVAGLSAWQYDTGTRQFSSVTIAD